METDTVAANAEEKGPDEWVAITVRIPRRVRDWMERAVEETGVDADQLVASAIAAELPMYEMITHGRRTDIRGRWHQHVETVDGQFLNLDELVQAPWLLEKAITVRRCRSDCERWMADDLQECLDVIAIRERCTD